MQSLQANIEAEAIRLTAHIAAGEDWAPIYSKAPAQHAKLIKAEARLQVKLTKYFKRLAEQAPTYISWQAYAGQIKADYNVEVIVQNLPDNDWARQLISLSFIEVESMILAGAIGGEETYKIPLGLSPTSANIQKLTTQRVAALVGKKVTDDGSIINNPKAKYNITQTVRGDIAQSIKTSLGLGENLQDAVARVQKIVGDPKRAERIARTESINAYQAGLSQFATDSGAVGQEWQDSGAIDYCADNTAAGPIPIGDSFPSGDSEPPAHPNCRCGRRLIYPQEWNELGL